MRILLLCLFIATLSFAQETAAQDTAPEPAARLQEIQQRLKLTDDQRDQIRPILQDEATKLKAIRDKYQDNNTSRRGKLKAARELKGVQEDIDKRVKPILTKDQQAEWKKIREERRDMVRQQKGR